MNDIQLFYLLKQQILTCYREAYPYYAGSIQQFGNREIAQLIDLIEQDCNTRVSEKWVYTHLKPETNSKLPRRDMLDIFCQWLGYSNWDEFAHKHKETEVAIAPKESNTPKTKKAPKGVMVAFMGSFIAISSAFIVVNNRHDINVCFKDKYTQKPIEAGSISVYFIKKDEKRKLAADDNCYTIKGKGLLVTESAYYKPDTLKIDGDTDDKLEIELQPDDYAMMLRAYMNGNVADWNKRRTQLAEIIADDAMIQEVMFDDIGVEFLNKEEFINKVTLPGVVAKNMEVVEVKYHDGKIISLKFMQKGK